MTDHKHKTPFESNTLILQKLNINSQIIKEYYSKIFLFKPITLELKEFNPLIQPYFSVPCLLTSLIIARYYRKKYFLIKAGTIRLFSISLNYAILYYLFRNGIELYNHLNSAENLQAGLESNKIE